MEEEVHHKSMIQIWNGLRDSVVGEIYNNGAQAFKFRVHEHPISIVTEGSLTSL